MTSLVPATRSIGAGARFGSVSSLLPQVGHCGRRATWWRAMVEPARSKLMRLSHKSVRNSVAIALAISTAASWMALCPSGLRASGDTATRRAGPSEQPGRTVGDALAVELGELSLEIVVHQRDGEVGGTLDDADAELAKGGAEFP